MQPEVYKMKFLNGGDAYLGAYWLIVTAIYLGWSFASDKWDFTWIVWPVAGVLFAAIAGIIRARVSNESISQISKGR